MILRRNPHKVSRKGHHIYFDELKLEMSAELRQMGYNAKIASVVHKRQDAIDYYTINLHHPFARLERISLAMKKHEKAANGQIVIRYHCDYTAEEYSGFWERNGAKILEFEKTCRTRRSLRLWQKD